jgi:hypothetical protein
MRALIIATTAALTLFSPVAFTQESSQSTASIPDLSGMWSYPYWPSFELEVIDAEGVLREAREQWADHPALERLAYDAAERIANKDRVRRHFV